METLEKWIICHTQNAWYYNGQSVPSTRRDLFSGNLEFYIPIMWSENINESTRFDDKLSAIDIAKLIAREIHIKVAVKKVKVQRKATQ